MFFFTDLDKLTPQIASQAFGPVAGEEEHKFLVTNKFKVKAGALAYMPVQGTILVQPVGNNPASPLVNIAIRVGRNLGNGYTPVSFIIYRGIKKNSIITSTESIIASGATDLATSLWKTWQKAQTLPGHDASTGPTLDAIGWNLTGVHPDVALSTFFGVNDLNLQLPTLAEGSCLGTFDDSGEIGVEVILNDPLLKPTLGLLQRATNVLVIPVSTYSVYHQTYEVKAQREQLLAYLDLGLFYALSAQGGIDYLSQGLPGRAKGNTAVYNKLLLFFANKNCVYLDIRNEISKSLNHYNEYQDETEPAGATPLFHLSFEPLPTPLDPFGATWPWPLYILKPSGSSLVRLLFKTARNPDPLVYLEYTRLTPKFTKTYGGQARFISLNTDGQANDILELDLPLVRAAGSPQLVTMCAAHKLMLVRRTLPAFAPAANPGKAPVRQSYLDSMFGPVMELAGRRPQEIYAKRWISGSEAGSKTMVGAIVEPSRIYTDDHVVFRATLLDSYSSEAGTAGGTNLATFGTQVQAHAAPHSYGPRSISPAREAFEINADKKKEIVKLPSAPVAPVLARFEMGSAPTTLELFITQTEYGQLVQIAQDNFDMRLGDVYCFFTPLTVENTIETNPQTRTQQVYSATLRLGGITPGGLYVALDEANMPLNLRVFSLDTLFLSSAASAQAATISLVAEPAEEYSAADFAADLRTIERVYAANDKQLDQSVTRVRVHFYGFIEEDGPSVRKNSTWWERFKNVKDHAGDFGKGYVFNLDIPDADYWEVAPGHSVCLNSAAGIIPFSTTDTTDDGCRVRQVHQGDAGISDALFARIGRKYPNQLLLNSRQRDATTIIDPGNNIVDMGHTLYTLDALFADPDIPGRNPNPSQGYVSLGIDRAEYLANFLGDLTGTLGVAYNQYYNAMPPSFRQQYSIRQYLAQQYDITSPLPDLMSDADGYALFAVWEMVFKKKLSTKLSQLVTYYYSDNATSNTEYTYKSRWKLFALGAGLAQKQPDGSYHWGPDEPKLRILMKAGYQIGYLGEAEQTLLGGYLAGRGFGGTGELITKPVLSYYTKDVDDADLEFILQKFLAQIKRLLQQEQPSWNIN